ncbi:glutathione S-transferase 1-like isoform X2 [Atheta coriaria]
MENSIDMYYFPASPPTRAVLMLARALGLMMNLKLVNIMEGEQMKPEFLKLNPMHTVPTMDDGGYVLWESKAIMKYLSDKYDKTGKFKAVNAEHEGKINEILYFDGTTLFPRLGDYMRPVMGGLEQPNNEKLSRIEEALKVLNVLLAGNKYAGGSQMSIADFALTSTVSTIEAVKVDLSPYANVMAWYKIMKKEMPGFDDIDKKGADMIAAVFAAKAA